MNERITKIVKNALEWVSKEENRKKLYGVIETAFDLVKRIRLLQA